MQGLLTRPDWQEACKVPLAMIPTGSGNALCANTGDGACPKAVCKSDMLLQLHLALHWCAAACWAASALSQVLEISPGALLSWQQLCNGCKTTHALTPFRSVLLASRCVKPACQHINPGQSSQPFCRHVGRDRSYLCHLQGQDRGAGHNVSAAASWTTILLVPVHHLWPHR